MKPATDVHEKIYQEINAVLRKYGERLTALEILAILSNMVGKVMAMQDQRRYTSVQIMEMVKRNIEIGNKQVIDELARGKPAGSA